MKDQLITLWNKIDSKIPVIIIIGILFILLDLWYVQGILDIYGKVNEFSKYLPPPKSKPFEPPPVPEIEVFDYNNLLDIPEQYKILKTTNIFVGPTIKGGVITEEVGVDVPEQKNENIDDQPASPKKIEGFTAKGLVYGADHKIGAVFIEGVDGKSYYAREGRRMSGTRIVVKKINRKSVILSQPGREDTEIFFQAEEFLQRWKRNEAIDPIELMRKEMKNRPAPVKPAAVQSASGDSNAAAADSASEDEEEDEE